MIRELLPEAEIVSRPRFSTLRYAGSDQAVAPAAALGGRRLLGRAGLRAGRDAAPLPGGAAVVMGALSPATRNAQVAMFQRGEVDYLVATDAIGMGLNMDVTHVAFAGLEKFDGRRDRRLTIAEMAQIAGRAGRHQRDGSFGTLGLGGDGGAGVQRRGDRRDRGASLPPARLISTGATPSSTSPTSRALIASLEAKSDDPLLRPAPLAIDLAVLKLIAEDPAIAGQARRHGAAAVGGVRPARFPQGRADAPCADGPPAVQLHRRGRAHPARMVRRRSRRGSTMSRAISRRWPTASPGCAAGPISPTAPTGWPSRAKWAERTREVEARLSDALHERLTQRFVDRRTAVLVRDIGARGADALPVTVAADGEVSVGPEPIGHLAGFDFRVDPTARLADKRLLLAAAERRLGDELDRRAKALARGARRGVRADRRGRAAGSRSAGRAMSSPGSRPAARCSSRRCAPPRARPPVGADAAPRCAPGSKRWLDARDRRGIWRRSRRWPRPPPTRPARPACARWRRCWPMPAASLPRRAMLGADRRARAGRPPGAAPAAGPARPARRLRPAAAQARRAALARGAARGALGPADAARCRRRARRCSAPTPTRAARRSPTAGSAAQWLRIDLADRLASHAHKVRVGRRRATRSTPSSRPRSGSTTDGIARLMAEIGFAQAGDAWRWRGRRPRAAGRRRPAPGNAFAALADLKR